MIDLPQRPLLPMTGRAWNVVLMSDFNPSKFEASERLC